MPLNDTPPTSRNKPIAGISTVHGNQSVEKTAVNAARVCVLAGLTCDVVEGQASPLVRTGKSCPEIHGESGLDGTALLPSPSDPAVLARLERWKGQKAAVVLAEQVLAALSPVALVATGEYRTGHDRDHVLTRSRFPGQDV